MKISRKNSCWTYFLLYDRSWHQQRFVCLLWSLNCLRNRLSFYKRWE